MQLSILKTTPDKTSPVKLSQLKTSNMHSKDYYSYRINNLRTKSRKVIS